MISRVGHCPASEIPSSKGRRGGRQVLSVFVGLFPLGEDLQQRRAMESELRQNGGTRLQCCFDLGAKIGLGVTQLLDRIKGWETKAIQLMLRVMVPGKIQKGQDSKHT